MNLIIFELGVNEKPMKKQIGHKVEVPSFTDPARIYTVFFSRLFPAGICECKAFKKNRSWNPTYQCKHIRKVNADLNAGIATVVPVIDEVPEDPFDFGDHGEGDFQERHEQ